MKNNFPINNKTIYKSIDLILEVIPYWRQNMKKAKAKVNFKRFTISLLVFVVITLLITNVSKKILAKNHNDKNIDSSKSLETYIDTNKDKKTDNPVEDVKNPNNEDGIPLEKGSPKDEKKVDKVEESVPQIKAEDNSSKPSEYKETFKDDLFLGDSITDSISFYDFLDESHVVAKLGLTSKEAKKQIEDIVKTQPKNIYIMFGMNDILTGESSKEFIKDYRELIQAIKIKLPDSNIYIQSILPVASKVKNKKPLLTNENVDDFNQALMDMAKDDNLQYLNIRSILDSDMDLLEPDGIHVKYKFYELWLDYLIENTK